jgi:hypothetical protein
MPRNQLHGFDIEAYEKVTELICYRPMLRNGQIICKETGNPYLFHQSHFDRFVAAGLIDPARVALVDGRLVDLALGDADALEPGDPET